MISGKGGCRDKASDALAMIPLYRNYFYNEVTCRMLPKGGKL